MKRILVIIGIVVILIALVIINFITRKNSDDDTKRIVVAEVTHSAFYAPWYVALHNGYFEDLEIEVVLTSGANNVVAAVLSGDADIGLCGPEATIYVYNGGTEDPVMSFAGLTKRDGQFLVLRNGIKYNDFKNIEGLTILAGRSGGMPLLNFQNALKNAGVEDVTIDTSVEFANLSSAFIAGNGDGVNLFEPNASTLVKNGYGYIATSIGTYSGEVPYTAFNAKKSYIEDNRDIIDTFYSGIAKGLDYVNTHSAEEIATIIASEFPDTSMEDLITMVDNYKKYDSWLSTPEITEETFENLEDIMIDNNELDAYVKYADLVYDLN